MKFWQNVILWKALVGLSAGFIGLTVADLSHAVAVDPTGDQAAEQNDESIERVIERVMDTPPLLRDEASLGYGIPNWIASALKVSSSFDAVFANEFSSDVSSAGPIILGYNHPISEVFHLGADLSYSSAELRIRYNNSTLGSFDATLWSLLPRLELRYVHTNSFAMYWWIQLGITYARLSSNTGSAVSFSQNSVVPMFQVGLLGFRFGGDLAGFLELGAGVNGLLVSGLSYRF